MAVLPVIPVLLVATIARCKGEGTLGYNHNKGNGVTQFGEILKPPPPPPLPQVSVPFHGGRGQRQSNDVRYSYQPSFPPLTSLQPDVSNSDFKFPAPFYKQYNFNFVPPPQPFTTTASPSLFEKVSGWLFPPQPTERNVMSFESNNYNIQQTKKDCNPCNLVPWIPVIKYNIGTKNTLQDPTYGPPSPTALTQNILQNKPQPFHIPSREQKQNQLSIEKPHISYGVPPQQHINNNFYVSSSSTYGPPSATHTIPISSHSSSSSTFPRPSTSYSLPSSSYGFPSSTYEQLSTSYSQPITSYSLSSSTHEPTSYITPLPSFDSSRILTTTPFPVVSTYAPHFLQNESPVQNNNGRLSPNIPADNLQLPKVSDSLGFKNSYGEIITNNNAFDISYSLTDIAAESSKIKTNVASHSIIKSVEPNISLALANPAPFSFNRGRNIHTLQPVALPNLSVSPLPPIFNARPFRPTTDTNFPTNLFHSINYMQKTSNNVNVAQSVPIAEFVHSVEYPTTIIQSPIIEIDASKGQNKSSRNIPNKYVIDEVRDISPQASEDHVSATKANQDASFETTDTGFDNDLYDINLPTDLKKEIQVPSNHKSSFADLRGVKDEDIDKYRTESNLQSIDSPLLYLKPNAPHKNYEHFLIAVTTPVSQNEYEIYDDVAITSPPELTNIKSVQDESAIRYKNELSSPSTNQDSKNQPKIVQIIVPYITNQSPSFNNNNNDKNLTPISQDRRTKEEYQGRKVPLNTDIPYDNTVTESSTILTTTSDNMPTVTDHYDTETMNTPSILNDFYDVKEPPFDIIKLQHTIDDWTEQEYSKQYTAPGRSRVNEKYAKQIPGEYFSTVNSNINEHTATDDYNLEIFDHEGSSSIQHSITETKNNTFLKPLKEYNAIDRSKNKHIFGKSGESDETQMLRIYTAASSFRSTSTTPAPWERIQTSISPLTKEKVYVVTSKPWRDKTDLEHVVHKFESKKTNFESEIVSKDDFPFKSPRFVSRPPFGFTASGPVSLDSIKSDSSYGFSKGWHQSINNLRSLFQSDSTLSLEGPEEKSVSNTEKDTTKTEDHL